MSANKFKTKAEKEDAIAKIATLDRRGYSLVEIGKQIGISHVQVHSYIKQIRKRYADSIINDHGWKVREKLEQYGEIRKEAWEAWERSKLNAEKVTTEKTTMEGGQRVKTVETREGQCGDPRFLEVYRKALEDERTLLGLDAPKKTELSGNVGVFDWVELAKTLQGQQVATIEDDLKKALTTEAVVTEVTKDSANGTSNHNGDNHGG